MSKKRKCRYTPEEVSIHEEAVRLRKMTDAQLVEAFQNASRTPSCAETREAKKDPSSIEKLLEGLANGECKGIKGGLAYKIGEYAKEKGLIA